MFDFLKKLFERPRRGVLVFREESWNARGEPRGEWVRAVLEKVRVLQEERAGGMVRLLCECEKFDALGKGEKPPQYLFRLTVKSGPDGESREVEFFRK